MKISRNHNFWTQFRILKWIFIRDLIETKQRFKNELFDALLWPIKAIILFAYLMPGLSKQGGFGPFILVGTVISTSIFAVFPEVNNFLENILFTGFIHYELILGVNSILLFLEKLLIFLIRVFIVNLSVYVIGSILIISKFSGIPFSFTKALSILFVINFMCGTLALLFSSIKNIRNIYYSNFSPILFTAWDFGCYLYNWQTAYIALPIFAYIILLDPFTYAMEGFRSAILGPNLFIDYWICLSVLIALSILILFISIKKLRKRLDCF